MFDESKMMQMQMGAMGPGANKQPFMATQAYKSEAALLNVARHTSAPLVAAEKELLKEAARIPKKTK